MIILIRVKNKKNIFLRKPTCNKISYTLLEVKSIIKHCFYLILQENNMPIPNIMVFYFFLKAMSYPTKI